MSRALWIRLYDSLEEHGIRVVLLNPSKTRLIAEARVKTDKVNARVLAQLLRADMLPGIHQSGDKTVHKRITRQGNRLVRWVMVQAAQNARLTFQEV